MTILEGSERLAIWGCGREGRAAYAFVREHYPALAPVILGDAPFSDPPAGAEIIAGPAAAEAVRCGRFDTVIKSPGISLRRPEILAARERGVRFTTATNLWFERHRAAKKIAVTGTKGKSSTARILHHLLIQAGYDARVYGNVGIAMLGQPPGRDVTVLELSSYQIADLEFPPDIAVITNLFPEHAPWHGGHENYYRDKLRILDLGETTGVCNYASARLRQRLAGHDRLVWFNARYGFAARGESLRFNGVAVDCTDFPLRGEHNYSNVAAACTAADLFGARGLRRRADLSTFRQLEHRLEEFKARGIACVNDSLSTVPEAALAALKTYAGRPIVLILGGADRGQDYSALIDFLPGAKIKGLLLLPATGARIFDELMRKPRPYAFAAMPDLAAAVREGFRHLKPGDVFLMSPASPSFGQFRNYEERGEMFKSLCRNETGPGRGAA
jgi:UDP-N-acetylmuramoyl-L-alanine---L-glutamate ligase